MNNHVKLYYLYCTNVQCKASIYNRMVERQIPFTADNLIKTHKCSHCDKPLVSAMDLAIKHVIAEVNSADSPKMNYHHN